MRVDRSFGIAVVLNVIIAMFALAGCGGGGDSPLARTVVDPPVVEPPVVEPPTVERRIATSFGATRLDHDRLDAQLEKPYEPHPPAYDPDPEAYQQALVAYQDALEYYAMELEEYEAGRCCWRMIPEESPIASREDVLAMLQENAFYVAVDPPIEGRGEVAWSVMYVYAEPPSVRFAEETSRQARAAALRAIDNINAWLPWEKHVTVGADLDAAASAAARENAEFDVGLYLDVDAENLGDVLENAVGNDLTNFITMSREYNTNVSSIQHELLHALGLDGGRACYETFGGDCDTNSFDRPQFYYSHVPVSRFPESTMAYASPNDDTYGLSQIDGEVLQAIYTREGLWGDGEGPAYFAIRHDRLSPESLGPWDDAVVRYSGNFDPALGPDWSFEPRFGVDWRNGMARPWAHGDITYNTFADSGLSGTVTWSGELVGFTPDREAVRGESAIQVDIAALDGSAAFVGLEHWASGAAPGNAGTGARWQDGNLHYSIALDGNHIRSNGGDAGYVSGRFVGEEHQGAVGILEHPDLAGAFGATR